MIDSKVKQANDRLVDRLYRGQAFSTGRKRVEHLFQLYEKLRAPVMAAATAKKKRRRKPV